MEISSFSTYDYISLVGHYNKIQHGDSIDKRLLDRGYTEAQLEILRKKQRRVSTIISLNLKFTSLQEFEYSHFGYVFNLYRQFEKSGVLPFSGCMADQPAQIIEIFNTIESLELERRQQEMDEQERRAKREKRGRR